MEKILTVKQEICLWDALNIALRKKRQQLIYFDRRNLSALIEDITMLRHLIELTRPSQIGSISVFRKAGTMKNE